MAGPKERDPFRFDSSSYSLRNKISSYGKNKKDNNHIVKLSMAFPPVGSLSFPPPQRQGFYNVKDFGAKGDGVADDTAAIQAALDAVPTGGGKVFFPVGTYLVKNLSLPNVAGITLEGETGHVSIPGGAGSELKALDSSVAYLLASLNYVNSTGYSGNPATIRHLRFDGDDKSTDCVILQSWNTTVDDCSIFGATQDGLTFTTIQASGAQISNNMVNCVVRGNELHNNGRYGFRTRSTSTKITDLDFESNLVFDNGGDGAHCDDSANYHVFGNHFYANEGWQFWCNPGEQALRFVSNLFNGDDSSATITEWNGSVTRKTAVYIQDINSDESIIFANNVVQAGVVQATAGGGTSAGRILSVGNNFMGASADAHFVIGLGSTARLYSTGDSFQDAAPYRGTAASGAVVYASNCVTSATPGISVPIDGQLVQVGSTIPLKSHHQVVTFGANDATPSVAGGYLFKTNNGSSTTVTALDDGHAGQVVRIIVNDANTTIDFTGTTLKGNQGSNWAAGNGDHMTCVFDGTNWYCDVSDDTA